MKLFLKIILSVFVLFILVSGSGIFYLTRGLEAGEALEVNAPNIAIIENALSK